MLWGHKPVCGCALCRSLPRVFNLLSVGTHSSASFGEFASYRVRSLEAELRDELSRQGIQVESQGLGPGAAIGGKGGAATPPSFPHLPAGPPPGANFFGPRAPLPPPPADQKGDQASQGPAPEPGLFAKRLPAEPPAALSSEGSGKGLVKEEPQESPPGGKGTVQELKGEGLSGEERQRKRKKSRSRKRKKSRSREKRDRKERKEEKEVRGEGEEKVAKESPKGGSPSPKPRSSAASSSKARGVEETPKREEGPGNSSRREQERSRSVRRTGRKEKKSRDEGTGLIPRPPSHSPPRRQRVEHRREQGSGSHQGRRGPGWIGPLPEYRHWGRGKNKGVVKRAKQARHNQRRDFR